MDDLNTAQTISLWYLYGSILMILLLVSLRLMFGPKRWVQGDIASLLILALVWPATVAVFAWDAILFLWHHHAGR